MLSRAGDFRCLPCISSSSFSVKGEYMALREILKYPVSGVLRDPAKKVEIIDAKILTVLNDMVETLQNAGGKGLAAPQIGIPLRLIVIRHETNYMSLINPVIIRSAGEQISLEGCLSLPGVYGKIKRPEFLIVQALDKNGKNIEMKALYRLASAFAHEIDHLDGILLIDKAIQVVNYRA